MILSSKTIVVHTGAGISTSTGEKLKILSFDFSNYFT